MDIFPKVGILLVVSVLISAIVTFLAHRSNSTPLDFLVTLKNLLVGVLIASCMMMITLLAREDIAHSGRDLNNLARDMHEAGRYFRGDIVVSTFYGSLLGYFITRVLVMLENAIMGIGETKPSINGLQTGLAATKRVLKSPFLFVGNIILAFGISVLAGSLVVLLELTVLRPFQNTVNWQAGVAVGAWCGAFFGYWLTRVAHKGRKRIKEIGEEQVVGDA